MATNTVIKTFSLKVATLQKLKELQQIKSLNLSKWVDKLLNDTATTELQGVNNGK